jgi:5-methylcytosine-specific restriction endonuclease McrBC regulatory subunit McrC
MSTSTSSEPVRLTIPFDYLEDCRSALVAEIRDKGEQLFREEPDERDSTARMLERDMALLQQVLAAAEDTTVEAEQGDLLSSPIPDMLEVMIRLLSKRLERVCVYGPMPMGDVLDIAEQLRWAASEATRLCPGLEHRLGAADRERAGA